MSEIHVNVDIALAKAEQFSKEGQYEEAIGICDNVISYDERCYAAYNERSCNLHALGRSAEAFRYLEKLIHLRPSSPTAYFRRARWRIELGEYETALKDLYQVIDFEDDYFNDSANFHLVIALANTNRINDALQACESLPPGFKEFVSTPSTPGSLLSRDQLQRLVQQGKTI